MKNDFSSLANEVACVLNDAVAEGRMTWYQAVRLVCEYNLALGASAIAGALRGELYADHRSGYITPLAQLTASRISKKLLRA